MWVLHQPDALFLAGYTILDATAVFITKDSAVVHQENEGDWEQV